MFGLMHQLKTIFQNCFVRPTYLKSFNCFFKEGISYLMPQDTDDDIQSMT
jgi:hypothetical protein